MGQEELLPTDAISACALDLRAPAKINLFLKVSGRRADGYHLLFSLMCCVGLYDIVRISIGPGKRRVVCNDPGLPANESNLAVRAISRFFEAWNPNRDQGADRVSLRLEKRIPVGAGLGGGSSDAAAVLRGLNQLCGHPLSRAKLARIGLDLGADVPFFLFGKPAIATGIGEKLQPYAQLPPYKVLLVYPGFGVSTAEVYKNLNLRLTNCKKRLRYSSFKKEKFNVDQHLCNDLESVTASRFPEIDRIKNQLLSLGACGALMSGSGSTVFGLFQDADQARLAQGAMAAEIHWQTFLADLLI
jgi:4-diphosphocytidyl-2-C-methyl-D-erythritol kinase